MVAVVHRALCRISALCVVLADSCACVQMWLWSGNWKEWKYVFNQRQRLTNAKAEKLVYTYANLNELARQAGAVAGPTRRSFIP